MLKTDSILLIRYFFTWYLNFIAIPVILVIYLGLIKKEKISTLLDHKMEPFKKFRKYTSIIVSLYIIIMILNIITPDNYDEILNNISTVITIGYLQLLSIYLTIKFLFCFVERIAYKKN